jgi:hypothetical protein
LHVATDYDGTYGDPSWHRAQPLYPGESADPAESADPGERGYGSGLPGAEPPGGGSTGWQRRTKASFLIAVTALVLGVVGLAVSLFGVATQMLPRQFTAQQQRQITNWEYGKRWRQMPAGQIFPASAKYAPPSALDDDISLTLPARRIGIARQASCRAATDAAAAAVLDRDGCKDMLRATYADGTGSYVVTVGVAVLPGVAQANAAAASLTTAGVDGIGPGVHAVSFRNTPAALFTDQRRQVSGAVSAGTYVVLYTAGYADSRPKEPVSKDTYGDAEMTAAAQGVAKAVRAVLAAPVTPASCPGAAGC